MTSADVALLFSAFAVLVGAYATYRNSVRKAEHERVLARVVDLERRLAEEERHANESDRRANESDRRAAEYRQAVIRLGEQIEEASREHTRRLGLVAADGNAKINKVVIVLEQVLNDVEAKTGTKPDVDIEALKRLVVIDHVTGKLGPLDVHAVKQQFSS